ncbi:MAG TPA: hydroxymethylbilane synthase [Chitinophagaceae bacterium]
MEKVLRVGTRDSQLAVWQATKVQQLLQQDGIRTELVPIKSEGDLDLNTPLYELGVQGIFTRSLDIALLNNKIDIAVHSLKDVPTSLAAGIISAAVLKRGPVKDLLVYKNDLSFMDDKKGKATIATSSIRRKAQWLHKYPNHEILNLRGNVNTRLGKVESSGWQGAIFAAAGLERIHLRPEKSLELDWMVPAPAQGAIVVVCRENDHIISGACHSLNDADTGLCTKIERDFLRTLIGGCSTPVGAYAHIEKGRVKFTGNICSPDGKKKMELSKTVSLDAAGDIGTAAALELLSAGADKIVAEIRDAEK